MSYKDASNPRLPSLEPSEWNPFSYYHCMKSRFYPGVGDAYKKSEEFYDKPCPVLRDTTLPANDFYHPSQETSQKDTTSGCSCSAKSKKLVSPLLDKIEEEFCAPYFPYWDAYKKKRINPFDGQIVSINISTAVWDS